MLGSRQELDQVGVDRVYRQLRAGDATDAQLPKGQSPTTTVELVPRYGVPGRPEHRYRWVR